MNTTIDKKEIDFFSNLSQEWWNLDGPFASLHKFTDARVQFILRNVRRINNKTDSSPLSGLTCLDIGCGGGILAERLSRLGGKVTGIDLSQKAINVAKYHSFKSGLKIKYECSSVSNYLTKKTNKFDLIIASEVIEHVINRRLFLSEMSKLGNLGTLVVITTINKTFASKFFAKFVAEYLLNLIPKGTHDTEKFVSPDKLIKEGGQYGIIFDDLAGFVPEINIKNIRDKQIDKFSLSTNSSINYGIAGLKTN